MHITFDLSANVIQFTIFAPLANMDNYDENFMIQPNIKKFIVFAL